MDRVAAAGGGGDEWQTRHAEREAVKHERFYKIVDAGQ